MASPGHGGATGFAEIDQSLIHRGGAPSGAAAFIIRETDTCYYENSGFRNREELVFIKSFLREKLQKLRVHVS